MLRNSMYKNGLISTFSTGTRAAIEFGCVRRLSSQDGSIFAERSSKDYRKPE